jgi:hypothetical protein
MDDEGRPTQVGQLAVLERQLDHLADGLSAEHRRDTKEEVTQPGAGGQNVV